MLGNRIKQIRSKVGLTSSMVSQYLGMDLIVYKMIENDEYYINYSIIEKLCLLFGCDEKVFYHDQKIDCYRLEDIDLEELDNIAHFRKICAQIR